MNYNENAVTCFNNNYTFYLMAKQHYKHVSRFLKIVVLNTLLEPNVYFSSKAKTQSNCLNHTYLYFSFVYTYLAYPYYFSCKSSFLPSNIKKDLYACNMINKYTKNRVRLNNVFRKLRSM